MITSIIVLFIKGLIAMFGFFPFTIPPMPSVISDGLLIFTDNIGNAVNLGRYLLTPLAFNAIVVILLGSFLFQFAYDSVMWVLRRMGH